ncbi:WXG100 family type VII secretion target [Microbacterium schleiferi]|uniref:ESAT-6-like protein n=1 Tax=Microbacterium schleiferi TaxID=69362 RepID=A0A7S8MVC2_9MICO|nr:WXG100 family type VII secretion target [Microbacterium schleiferi]QPE03929.1 WXG100 family type VII secretion target [Microbacterium schleiferi]
MAIYSVDSDAVLAATAGVRATADRVRAETHAMLAQLTGLQSQWTGAASVAFSGVIDQWRAANVQVEEALSAIGVALETAGHQYAEAEQMTLGLFR